MGCEIYCNDMPDCHFKVAASCIFGIQGYLRLYCTLHSLNSFSVDQVIR